jgi:hypothetical protein
MGSLNSSLLRHERRLFFDKVRIRQVGIVPAGIIVANTIAMAGQSYISPGVCKSLGTAIHRRPLLAEFPERSVLHTTIITESPNLPESVRHLRTP